MDASQLAQYQQLYNQTSNPIALTAGGANQGLQNFVNTPQYQLMYGSGAANNLAAGGAYNPIQAFQQSDPSYQYQIDQALRNVNNSSAGRGLLESGATQRDLLNTAQNMQNTQYQNWLGQNNALFTNYQNQLANLTNLGAQNTGAANANANGMTLAQLLSNANLATGQNIAQANLGTGSNISSLLANQGVLNAGSYLNTAAAQANNIFQGNQFQAQINANNLASNAGTASGNASAMGYGNAARLF